MWSVGLTNTTTHANPTSLPYVCCAYEGGICILLYLFTTKLMKSKLSSGNLCCFYYSCFTFILRYSHTTGKVFGTEKDYLIAEAEYPEGVGEEEEEEEGKEEGGGEGDGGEGGDEEGSEEEKDEPPKSQWKPLPTVPKEEPKSGVNKKTYFVCNERMSESINTQPC